MSTTANPIDLLFSGYRKQVLALLLMRPDESFHVREISRLTGVPAGSLHRELRALANAELLLHESVGNQVRYRANRACPIFPELAGMFRKTVGLVDVLREALMPVGKRVHVAFVFGSIAQGAESAASDIDLFVIGSATFTEIVMLVSPLRERLGREVNPVVMKRAEFVAQRKSKDRFVARVMGEPKLFLFGGVDDLG
jgi:predicted nucleotidyltransferase